MADLSLRWAQTHFVGFDMSRLILSVCRKMSSRASIGVIIFTFYGPLGLLIAGIGKYTELQKYRIILFAFFLVVRDNVKMP